MVLREDIKYYMVVREDIKYYFADFVRNGEGGVPPKSVTPFLPKMLSVNWEGVYHPNP